MAHPGMQTIVSKPMLVAMKGHPGTGKSTLATSIAKAFRWPLIDKDDIRDCLVLMEASPSPSPSPSSKRLNAVSYEIMWRIAESQLSLGLGVVVDCPLAYSWLLKDGLAISKRHKVPMIVIECTSSDSSLWKERLEKRAESAMAKSSVSHDEEHVEHDDDGDEVIKRLDWAGGLLKLEDLPMKVRWHKYVKWEEVQEKLKEYGGCWDYHISPEVKRLVVDSAADNFRPDSVLDWIKSLV